MKYFKYKFFWVPIIFTYSYKSLFYNNKNKESLNLQTNIFWNSLSRFSYKLLAGQPVDLSTLKIIKKKKLFFNFFETLIYSNFWFSFTLTDLLDTKITLNMFKKKFFEKYQKLFDIKILMLDKKFLSFLKDKNLIKEIYENNNNIFSFFEEDFFNKKNVYGVLTASNFYYFLIKYFSNFNNSFNSSNNFNYRFNLKKFDIKNFFYETWVFVFFKNELKSSLKFFNFFELIQIFKLKNSIVFLEGFFFLLSELNYLNFYWNKIWTNNLNNNWKNIDISLQMVFLKIFKKTDFLILKKSLLLKISTNVFSFLLTKFYFFNKILTHYYFIYLIFQRIKIYNILILQFKWFNFFLCQHLVN